MLRRDGRMSLQGRSLNSIDTYRFGDGYEAEFIHVDLPSRQVRIGVADAKCLEPALAGKLAGAEVSPVREDAHGIDRGATYIRKNDQVLVRLSSTPVTDACIESIYVSRKVEGQP